MKVFTVDELKEVLRKHLLWVQDEYSGERANLSKANLRGADLSGANLSYANLRGADLSGADLRKANLSYANLSKAELRDADLSYANLSYANLNCADLRKANLSYANLSKAELRDADLSYANLSYANLNYADLRKANLSYANLILIGQDDRGYLFWAFVGDSGVVEIRAGCRHFVGISAARAHWSERHQEDKILHEDCLSLIDRCERMAAVRGWKLEV